MVFWEMTQACDLACRHCRACAVPEPSPLELRADEAEQLLRDVREMGTNLFVLTGGDPAKRKDLVHLVRYGTELGLRMALTPSATPLVTAEMLSELKDAGLARLAVSLDGALLLAVIAEPGRASVYRLEGASAGHARCRRIASQPGGPIEALATVDRSLVALREGRLEHLALESPLSPKPDLSPKPEGGRSG